MKNIIKLLSLVFVLSLTTVACNSEKSCDGESKKECCEKKGDKKCSKEDKEACKKKCAEAGKECDKEGESCKPGCEKPCCAAKADSTTNAEVIEDDHVHPHDDHTGHDH